MKSQGEFSVALALAVATNQINMDQAQKCLDNLATRAIPPTFKEVVEDIQKALANDLS